MEILPTPIIKSINTNMQKDIGVLFRETLVKDLIITTVVICTRKIMAMATTANIVTTEAMIMATIKTANTEKEIMTTTEMVRINRC